jgi:diadenosine tetraphosphate (Ap4A) HIT family hydrolase
MIHPQLIEDCHRLGSFASSTVLLHRNASLPWFILVPDTELEDLLDLPAEKLQQVTEDCQRISTFLKQNLAYDKVNFAGLGNVVPQMHLHIIGRSTSDACWPQPVWGNLSTSTDYDSATLAHWREQLVSEYGLCVTE